MKNFTSFKIHLTEVLNPEEKRRVDTWSKGDNSFSDHMFTNPHDNQRQSFELEDPNKSGHQEVVKSHLEPHGFKIKDYVAGKAEDKYGRETSIGKALAKTKAPEDMQHKFQNDPSRQQKGVGDLHLSISRHPHDVAGMTSEGHSWENESCMNFKSGGNREYLKEDVKHGTHVAYLTKKDDHENEKPLARVSLKKYTNIDNPNDHILRPENRTYGNAPDKFNHTLNKVINHHFPGDDNAIYKKNENVYDDTGNLHIIGKNAIDKVIKSDDSGLKNSLLEQHEDLTPEQLHSLSEGRGSLHHPAIAAHKNVSPKTLQRLYDIGDGYTKSNVVRSDNLNSDNINHILSGKKNERYKLEALKHPNVTKKNIDTAMKDEAPEVVRNAVVHPLATKKHLDSIVNNEKPTIRKLATNLKDISDKHADKLSKDEDYRVRQELARNPNLKDKYMDRLSKDEEPSVRMGLADNINIKDKHIDALIKDDDDGVTDSLSRNPNLKPKHIQHFLEHGEIYQANEAIKNKNSDEKNLLTALDHDWGEIRHSAIRNKNATPVVIDKALNNKNSSIRLSAIKHPNVNEDNLKKAMEDDHPPVRYHAIIHPNSTKEIYEKAKNDSNHYIRSGSLESRHATPEHMDKGIKEDEKSGNLDNTYHIMQNPNIPDKHLEYGLNHHHENIVRMALRNPRTSDEQLKHALNHEDHDVRDTARIVLKSRLDNTINQHRA